MLPTRREPGYWIRCRQAAGNRPSRSQNLARAYLGVLLFYAPPGAGWQPVVPETEGDLANLMSDDPAAAADLPTGQQTFLLDLQDLYRIERFAFDSGGAAGTASLFAGGAPHPPESDRWSSLGKEVAFAGGGLAEIRFPLEETRFVLVKLSLQAGGPIKPFTLTGDATLADFTVQIPPVEEWTNAEDSADRVEFDHTRLSAGGRITHVGSGNAGNAHLMIDDDPETAYDFPSDIGDGVFLIQLSAAYPLIRASVSINETVRTVEIRLFETLPDSFSVPGGAPGEASRISIPPEYVEGHTPDGRVELTEPSSFVRVPLPEAQAQYILVRVIGDSSEGLSPTISQFSVVGEVPREYAAYGRWQNLLQPATTTDEFAAAPANPAPDPPRIPVASP